MGGLIKFLLLCILFVILFNIIRAMLWFRRYGRLARKQQADQQTFDRTQTQSRTQKNDGRTIELDRDQYKVE